MARNQNNFDNSDQSQITVNGQIIRLSVPSDRAVVERVGALIDSRVAEDDWRPHTSREAALQCWGKLGGIRVAVLESKRLALSTISDIRTVARAFEISSPQPPNQRHPGLRNEQPKAPHW